MASVKTVLRKTRLSNGKYPICLRITKDRKSKFFKTIFDCNEKEWESKSGRFNKKNSNYTQNNRLLGRFEDRALEIINELKLEFDNFSLEEFELRFRVESNPVSSNLFYFWNEVINEMIVAGRIGNAKVNQETLKSIRKFAKNDAITFSGINISFLEKYEVFLRSNSGTNGGIGVKMRTLRALYNNAIRRGIVKQNRYPFNTYKISKFRSRSFKRSITRKAISDIENLNLNEYPQSMINAQKYFLFSFYNRGMNFVDMMNLKWKDIINDTLFYRRSKTNYSFTIKLLPPAKRIIDYYRSLNNGNEYVFPILLHQNYSIEQKNERRIKVIRRINKNLKEIAAMCAIETPITFYVARHSFATHMIKNNASLEMVKETLGHTDIKTTHNYIADLSTSEIDDACEALLL